MAMTDISAAFNLIQNDLLLTSEVCLDSGVGEGSVFGPGIFKCRMCSVMLVVTKQTRQC